MIPVRPFTNVLTPPGYLTVRRKGGGCHEVDPGDPPKGKRGGVRIWTAPALRDGALPLSRPGVDGVGGTDGDGRPVRPGFADVAGDRARRSRAGHVGGRGIGKPRGGGPPGAAGQNVMKV